MRKLRFEELPEVNSARWLSKENLEGEEWRDVVGYDGLYLVSCYGRIKRLPNHRETDKRETHNNIRKNLLRNGYWQVSLSKDNCVKYKSVHRMVAMAFLPNLNNYPQVNHKDENKLNNHIDNLEFCTARYNCLCGTGIERQKAARRLSDLTNNSRRIVGEKLSKKVCQRDLNGNVIAYFNSLIEAARKVKGHRSDISRCCRGIAKQSKGYKWNYV